MARVYWRNKVIGTIDKRVFLRRISGVTGMLRVPRAWAIQADNYNRDLKGNVDKIIFIDTDSGLQYETTFDRFTEKMGKINRGFGEQYYLTLDLWTVKNPKQTELRLK